MNTVTLFIATTVCIPCVVGQGVSPTASHSLPGLNAQVTQRAHPVVWVVDRNGGGDFIEIADAVQVMASGDVLAVRAGIYAAPVTVDSKSVFLVALDEGSVQLSAPLVIEDLSVEQEAVISGLHMIDGLAIQNCAGPVKLQSCSADHQLGSAVQPNGSPFAGTDPNNAQSVHVVENSERVTLVDCSFKGQEGPAGAVVPGFGGIGESALRMQDSTVVVYSCDFTGGNGGGGFNDSLGGYPSGAGAHGLHLNGQSNLYDWQTTAQGGDGGEGTAWGPASDGLTIANSGSGQIVQMQHEWIAFELPSVARTGTAPGYSIAGPPGMAVSLFVCDRLGWTVHPANTGFGHMAGQIQLLPLGVFTAAGTLQRRWPVEGPGSLRQFRRYDAQATFSVLGRRVLSEPRSLFVLHPAL